MPRVNDAAASEVQAALVAALRTDVPLQEYLHEWTGTDAAPDAFGRVFDDGTVPAELVGRWVTIGAPSEDWRPTIGRGGSAYSLLLHLWHTPVEGDDVGKGVVLEVWRLVGRALSPRLVLPSHTMRTGSAVLVGIERDSDGQSWHGVVRYDAITQVGVST